MTGDCDVDAFVQWCLNQNDILARWLDYQDHQRAHERLMSVWTAFRESVTQS